LDKNNGDAVVTATEVKLDQDAVKLPVPKKMKGKEVSFAEFNQKLEKYIKGAMDSRENPFWRIRY